MPDWLKYNGVSFNSRSRGGSDYVPDALKEDAPCFNSRSRGGSDKRKSKTDSGLNVSIHAPAGGATGGRRECLTMLSFNSRSRGGSDARAKSGPADCVGFNSRSRGGSDKTLSVRTY